MCSCCYIPSVTITYRQDLIINACLKWQIATLTLHIDGNKEAQTHKHTMLTLNPIPQPSTAYLSAPPEKLISHTYLHLYTNPPSNKHNRSCGLSLHVQFTCIHVTGHSKKPYVYNYTVRNTWESIDGWTHL